MKNKSLFILFFILGIVSPIFSQSPTSSQCKSFHVGTFYDKHAPGVVIVRDDKFQTETDEHGKYMKMSITWTSDCTYELRYVKSNSRAYRKSWRKMKVLVVNIVECDDDSYNYIATSPAIPMPIPGVIVKKK